MIILKLVSVIAVRKYKQTNKHKQSQKVQLISTHMKSLRKASTISESSESFLLIIMVMGWHIRLLHE
jgi:hypothetical protein